MLTLYSPTVLIRFSREFSAYDVHIVHILYSTVKIFRITHGGQSGHSNFQYYYIIVAQTNVCRSNVEVEQPENLLVCKII